MLGFLKKIKKSKKEKDSSGSREPAAADLEKDPDKIPGKKPDKKTGKKTADKASSDTEASLAPAAPAKKKKKFSFKIVIIVLLVLVAVGASGFVVYTFYFSPKNSDEPKPVYKKIELKHVGLPEEILKFSFEYLPDLYQTLIVFNTEMDLIDTEISRIDSIAQQYPDQKKIADKEKKIWEKTRDKAEKSFLKIEKPVKETYVLFRVNKDQGLAQIKERQTELAQTASAALEPVQELTGKLKNHEEIPKGFFNSTLYKLKKKFL